jgi:hypothetical protein
VPKETKKFINPLLRPSQGNTEPRPASPSIEPALTDLPSLPIEIPGEAVPSDVDRREVPQGPEPEPEPEVTTEIAPAPVSSISYSQEPVVGKSAARELREAARKSSPRTVPASAPQPSVPESVPEQSVSDDDAPVYAPPEPVVTSARSVTTRSASEARNSAKPTAESRSGVSTPTRAVPFSAKNVDRSGENISRRAVNTSSDALETEERSITRRRRHIQSFESTHERITLWIDSQLKQDFEDLALTRNTSKTAMLDEAIADLLHKYME